MCVTLNRDKTYRSGLEPVAADGSHIHMLVASISILSNTAAIRKRITRETVRKI